MFNKMKKLIAVSLAAVMVCSLAACGEKPTGGDTTPTPTPKSEADMTPMEKMDAYYAEYPAFDMEGRVIKIAMFYDAYFDSYDTKPEDNQLKHICSCRYTGLRCISDTDGFCTSACSKRIFYRFIYI